MARTPIDDIAHIAKDVAYVTVGLGVIAFQRLQVRRNELSKSFNGPVSDAKGLLDGVMRSVGAHTR